MSQLQAVAYKAANNIISNYRIYTIALLVMVIYFIDVWLLSSLSAGVLKIYYNGLSVIGQAVPDIPSPAWYFQHPLQVTLAWTKHIFGYPLSTPQVFKGWLAANLFIGVIIVVAYSAAKRKDRIGDTGGTSRFISSGETKRYLAYKYMPGIIFGQVGTKPVILKPNAPGNRNVAVFGPPGSMKSAGYMRNNLFQAVRSGWSVIVTDPKGELVRDYKNYFVKKDYTVKVFNLVSMLNSDRWNPLAEVNDDISAQNFCNIVIANTSVPGRKGGDLFWDRAEMNLLKALVLYVVHELPPNNKNLGALYTLLACGDSKELDNLFAGLSPTHPSRLPYNLFLETSGTVRSGVIIGLGTRLEVFQNRLVRELTADDDIDLELPGKEKCAYFCIISDTESSFDFLASLFFSFLFTKLTKLADRQKNGVLEVPVNFLMDEFCNISGIPDFEKKISTMRGRGIACSVIFQNIPQLMRTYPDRTWEIILGDCDYWLILGAREKASAGYISDIIGNTTVEKQSDKRPKGIEGVINPWEGSITTSPEKRALMDLAEVGRMDMDECILRLSNGQVIKLKKMHYTKYPWARELEPQHIEEYLPEWAARYIEQDRLVEAGQDARDDDGQERDETEARQEESGRSSSQRRTRRSRERPQPDHQQESFWS